MAKKNLMAQENVQYYDSMKAVEQNVENYMQLVQGLKMPESDYKTELLNRLEKLLDTLRLQERTFYTRLGINGAGELRNLQNKIEDWNRTGAYLLLEQKTVQGVFDCVVATIDEAEFLAFVNDFLESGTWLLDKDMKEIIDENVVDFFNSAFQDLIKNGKITRFNKNGLDAQVSLIKHGKGYSIKTLKNSKISNGMKSKLIKLVQTELNKSPTINAAAIDRANKLLSNSKDSGSITDNIVYYLDSIIPPEAMRYIEPEIRSGAYARWANYYVIQGYLGEVYWNACMKYLFGYAGDVRALGNTKNLRGKSLSVDMFVEGAGFQIKTWRLKEVIQEEEIFQTHTTTTNMYFGNFLQSRAQILDELTGQIIARMFGSMSYNLPNAQRDADEQVGDNSISYSKFYDKSNKEWPNTMKDLALIFRGNLSEILGISGQNAIADTGEAYYNTFWAINDKIIPSSLIIEELIHSLRSVSETSLIDFEVNLKNTTSKPVWDSPLTDMSDIKMANRWKIDYATCFNMTRLLDAAAKKA